jgi:hypothetical protein
VAVSVIDERIQELVAAHRSELEHLVDAELDRQLARLVDERLAARNGNAATAIVSEVKVCAGPCGRALPLSKFEAHRSKCRECRRAEQHARQEARAQEPDPEPPRSGDGA